MSDEFKSTYITRMSENLTLLRTSINLTQEDLAEMIGLSRFTLIAIEKKQRTMTWNTFLSLLLVFRANEKSRMLMIALEIYTDKLRDFLTVDEQRKKYIKSRGIINV